MYGCTAMAKPYGPFAKCTHQTHTAVFTCLGLFNMLFNMLFKILTIMFQPWFQRCNPRWRDVLVSDDGRREEKDVYYSITAETILAQPSSHSVQTYPSCAYVKGGEEEEEHRQPLDR